MSYEKVDKNSQNISHKYEGRGTHNLKEGMYQDFLNTLSSSDGGGELTQNGGYGFWSNFSDLGVRVRQSREGRFKEGLDLVDHWGKFLGVSRAFKKWGKDDSIRNLESIF